MNSTPRAASLRIAAPIASGLLWSLIWLGAGTLLLSLLLFSSSLQEAGLLPWVMGVHAFASFAGGFVAARRAGRRGWSMGAATGVLYTLLVLMASFLATDADWSARVLTLLAATGVAGALGGVFGVNTGSAGKR